MAGFFGKDELDNLESLKQDLVGPLKSFISEVHEDTVGDAKRFYSAKAGKAKQSARLAQARAKEQMAALKHEQEKMQRQRRAAMKRAAIILAAIALFALIISAALSAHAAGSTQLPEYEQTVLCPLQEQIQRQAPEKRRGGLTFAV